jgi:hypothetical protein
MTFRAPPDLKYLAGVIEESLHIYPPFVVPPGGALVNGQSVPEGVRIKLRYMMPASFDTNNRSLPSLRFVSLWVELRFSQSIHSRAMDGCCRF